MTKGNAAGKARRRKPSEGAGDGGPRAGVERMVLSAERRDARQDSRRRPAETRAATPVPVGAGGVAGRGPLEEGVVVVIVVVALGEGGWWRRPKKGTASGSGRMHSKSLMC